MTDLVKPLPANDTVNGSAYINYNSLKIPQSEHQTVESPAKDQDILAVSGILVDKFDDITYYTT